VEGSKILLIFAVAFVLAFSYQGAEANGPSEFEISDDGGGDCGAIGSWNQDTLTCTLEGDFSIGIIISKII